MYDNWGEMLHDSHPSEMPSHFTNVIWLKAKKIEQV